MVSRAVFCRLCAQHPSRRQVRRSNAVTSLVAGVRQLARGGAGAARKYVATTAIPLPLGPTLLGGRRHRPAPCSITGLFTDVSGKGGESVMIMQRTSGSSADTKTFDVNEAFDDFMHGIGLS